MELALNDAIRQVRARLDELSAEETDMMLSSADDRNLETTIEELMPEAIKSVHLSAPLSLLRGVTIDNKEHKARRCGWKCFSARLSRYFCRDTEAHFS